MVDGKTARWSSGPARSYQWNKAITRFLAHELSLKDETIRDPRMEAILVRRVSALPGTRKMYYTDSTVPIRPPGKSRSLPMPDTRLRRQCSSGTELLMTIASGHVRSKVGDIGSVC